MRKILEMTKLITKLSILSMVFSVMISKTLTAENGWFIQIPPEGTANLWDVFALNEDTVIACGSNGMIIRTCDGGMNWTQCERTTSDVLRAVQFVNNKVGHIVGSGGVILRTNDAGITWRKINININIDNLKYVRFTAVHFLDENVGYIAGWNSLTDIFLKTIDGGVNWESKMNWIQFTVFNDMFFITDKIGWILGNLMDENFLMKTTNGGATWCYINYPSYGYLERCKSIFFISEQIGWSVGHYDFISKSTDGGKHWFRQESGTSETLNSIYFHNKNIGWACGISGVILNTLNGGEIWTTQVSGTENQLNAIHFTNEKVGWAVGSYATILKTIHGSASVLNQKTHSTPVDYTFQIYPNPFNSSTNIKFQLNSIKDVEVSIYNNLNQKVITLINKRLQPGQYTINWNGQNCNGLQAASGIYFIKFKTEMFIETKKLVLLR